MNTMKKLLCAALALTMLLTLTACGGDGGSDRKEITFVLDWTPNTNHTGLYVALEMGWFADAGLDVKVVQPPEDGAEMLVGSGRADFGVSFQDYLAPVITGGVPVTAVAAVIQHNTSGIISRAGEGMDRPAGLAGKRYATWELPVELATMEAVVKADGGEFDSVIRIPSTVTDEVSALQSNSVDAIWIFYAWAGIACETAGLATDYFAFADIDPVFDYYTPVIIANNELLENDPDTAKAFLAALSRGYGFACENPDEAAEILLRAAPELESNRELVLASQRYLADRYTADAERWGEFDAGRWNGFFNWLGDNGLVERPIPENTGFTNEYLP